jgi:hypothetical protein
MEAASPFFSCGLSCRGQLRAAAPRFLHSAVVFFRCELQALYPPSGLEVEIQENKLQDFVGITKLRFFRPPFAEPESEDGVRIILNGAHLHLQA